MKKIFFILIFSTCAIFAEVISLEVTPQTVEDENLQILDVSSSKDFLEGHLEKAIWIPIKNDDGTSLNYAFVSQVLDSLIDSKKPVGVICKTSTESSVAAKMLEGRGFEKVIILEGGMDALKNNFNYEKIEKTKVENIDELVEKYGYKKGK